MFLKFPSNRKVDKPIKSDILNSSEIYKICEFLHFVKCVTLCFVEGSAMARQMKTVKQYSLPLPKIRWTPCTRLQRIIALLKSMFMNATPASIALTK